MENNGREIDKQIKDKDVSDFDVQSLKDNLKLTVYQRICKHQGALDLANKLRKAKKL